MPSTFSFLHKPIAKLRTDSKQKRKRACHFPLLQQLKSSANFRLKEDLATHNSTYKKLAVQWSNEDLCFVSSSVVADSFVLRNRQLLVAAKRCVQL
jgi:hypothetical protein